MNIRRRIVESGPVAEVISKSKGLVFDTISLHMEKYENEAEVRWGHTEAFKESKKRTSGYTKADFQAAKNDQEAATELFVHALGNKLPVDSAEAQSAVKAHREAISKWFYPCSVDMQKQLALLYVEDQRFKEYYEGRLTGLAQYVHDAINAQ